MEVCLNLSAVEGFDALSDLSDFLDELDFLELLLAFEPLLIEMISKYKSIRK